MWTKDQIRIELDDDLTDDPVITASISTPDGVVAVMAEAIWEEKTLILHGLHIHGENIGKNKFGFSRLRNLVWAVLDSLENCDEIVVEGAIRTSGAGKGHLPRPVRFTREALVHQKRRVSEHSGRSKGFGY